MAKTRDYMDYLDENIEIAPANSQEEYQAAETIAGVMRDHGLEASIEEFDAHTWSDLLPAVLTVVAFVALIVTNLTEGVVHVVALLLALAGVGILLLSHFAFNVFEGLGPAARSQNVVGVHRAEGSKVVKGARPIVIVAHYDTPRESLLRKGPLARVQATLRRTATPCAIAVCVMLVVQAMAFLPAFVRTFAWVVGLIASLPLLFLAVAAFYDRFAPCTLGANDNKSSVAALLSILDKVRPSDDRVGSDHDSPQRAVDREAQRALDARPRRIEVVEEVHGVRHGADVLAALGILPPDCEVIYEEPKVRIVEEPAQGTLAAEEPEVAVQYDEDADVDTDESSEYTYDEPSNEEGYDEQTYESEYEDDSDQADELEDQPEADEEDADDEADFEEDSYEDEDEYAEEDYDEFDEDYEYEEDGEGSGAFAGLAGIGAWFAERFASIRERFAAGSEDDDSDFEEFEEEDYEENDAWEDGEEEDFELEEGEEVGEDELEEYEDDELEDEDLDEDLSDEDDYDEEEYDLEYEAEEDDELASVYDDDALEWDDADEYDEEELDEVDLEDEDVEEIEDDDLIEEDAVEDETEDAEAIESDLLSEELDDDEAFEPLVDDYNEWIESEEDLLLEGDLVSDDEDVASEKLTIGDRVKGLFGKLRGSDARGPLSDEHDEDSWIDEDAAVEVEAESYDEDDEAFLAEEYDGGIYDYYDEYEEEEEEDTTDVEEEAEVEFVERPSDPNELHFDREEDGDIVPRDTTGLDMFSDSYDLYAEDPSAQGVVYEKPAPIDDPNWGVSTYQPARPVMNIARRAALFDLPDPSANYVDPLEDEEFEEYEEDETYSGTAAYPNDSSLDARAENDGPAYEVDARGEQGSRGFWGDSSSRGASDWKGGATLRADLRENSEEEPLVIDADDLQDAILEMGDEFLIAHDIWFVATGASAYNHAGIKAFLDEHRRDIRGAFLVNLESIGAGGLSVIVREGLRAPRRADRRLVRMLTTIAEDLHIPLDTAIYDWDECESATAMRSRVRSVSIMGMDDNNLPAYSHTADDQPDNVDPHQVSSVVRLVTELIRRS